MPNSLSQAMRQIKKTLNKNKTKKHLTEYFKYLKKINNDILCGQTPNTFEDLFEFVMNKGRSVWPFYLPPPLPVKLKIEKKIMIDIKFILSSSFSSLLMKNIQQRISETNNQQKNFILKNDDLLVVLLIIENAINIQRIFGCLRLPNDSFNSLSRILLDNLKTLKINCLVIPSSQNYLVFPWKGLLKLYSITQQLI